MNVKDLVERLKELPDDMPVMVDDKTFDNIKQPVKVLEFPYGYVNEWDDFVIDGNESGTCICLLTFY